MDRTCVKCGVVFSGGNRALHCGNCKPQASLDWRKQHYEKERETILDNARKYRDENREILYAKAREKYRLNNDDSDYLAKVKEKRLRHYEKNKEEIKLKNSKIRREAQDNTLSNADNNGAFWSDEEIRFLWKYAETKTAEDIALALKRTLLSVQGKAGAEGIRFGEENRHGCYGIVSERVDAEGRSGRPEPLEIVGDVDEFGNIIAKKHVDENLNKMILNQAYYVLKSYFEGKKKEDRIVDTLDLKAIYSWLWNNNMVDYIENLNNENKDKIITITDK
jgi:predicted  nucleic acid-binding Zn-ribbon protein